MADTFKSREILKNVNKTPYRYPEEGKHVRRIRGLYVTGVWRPPHYIDRVLFVTGFGGTESLVEAFTERTDYKTPGDYAVAISEVKATPVAITRFTQNAVYAKPGDYAVAITEVKATPITITHFSEKSEYALPGDYAVAITEVKASGDINITHRSRNLGNDIPPGPPVLQIRSIGSEPAEVTNET